LESIKGRLQKTVPLPTLKTHSWLFNRIKEPPLDCPTLGPHNDHSNYHWPSAYGMPNTFILTPALGQKPLLSSSYRWATGTGKLSNVPKDVQLKWPSQDSNAPSLALVAKFISSIPRSLPDEPSS
jgi:hypothetical protein